MSILKLMRDSPAADEEQATPIPSAVQRSLFPRIGHFVAGEIEIENVAVDFLVHPHVARIHSASRSRRESPFQTRAVAPVDVSKSIRMASRNFRA